MPSTTSLSKQPASDKLPETPSSKTNGCDASMLTTSQTEVTGAATSSSSSFDTKLANTLEVIRETFRRYSAATELFLSFNGGKDCTVLLHLADRVLRELHPTNSAADGERPQLLCLYLQTPHPFSAIERFVDECTRRYAIRLVRSAPPDASGHGQSKQQALFDLCAERPGLRACLMGCRRSDPWCERLGVFEETTAGWPPLMRVNPLLEWTCADVWDYVERFEVPYCELYDRGYTSLGDETNTRPNPHLRHIDPVTGAESYRPAHTLRHQDELERVGRFVPDNQQVENGAAGSSNNNGGPAAKEPPTSS